MVSMIVLNYRDADTTIELVRRCENFDSIQNIIIVDNASNDISIRKFKEMNFPEKVVILEADKNGGYGAGNNIGIRYAWEVLHSEYILVCNPDVEFQNPTVYKLLEVISKDKNMAIVAPKMQYPNGNISKSYWGVPSLWGYSLYYLYFMGHFFKEKEENSNEPLIYTECVAGSMFMAKTEVIYHNALYDENIFLYCEETVQGIMLKNAGYHVAVLGNETFLHKHSVSIKKSIPNEIARFRTQWNSRIYVLDHYYPTNFFTRIMLRTIMQISILERTLMLIVKKK